MLHELPNAGLTGHVRSTVHVCRRPHTLRLKWCLICLLLRAAPRSGAEKAVVGWEGRGETLVALATTGAVHPNIWGSFELLQVLFTELSWNAT